jgi:ferritin-like metal-binding protein YciE
VEEDMALNDLKDIYIEELRDAYSFETQIIDALPTMIENATNGDLKTAFQQHLEQTKRQKERLDRIAQMTGSDISGHTCKGMQGIIKEAEELMSKRGDAQAKDAVMISAAQRVEHYEIAAYGSLRTYAEQLGRSDEAQLLSESLDEEKNTDEKLTQIAESHINQAAQA